MLVSPYTWRPVGIADLEPNAWKALRATTNTIVTAGPGAGKTEFLAQRAAYLLQTGLCPFPRRILAISFKTDAAANLRERIALRCAERDARRFTSVTFDSFTKSLVDRFRLAIPNPWRPKATYEILFASSVNYRDFLTRTRFMAPVDWQAEIVGLPEQDFERKVIGRHSLPAHELTLSCGREFAVSRWWTENLQAPTIGRLSFTMLNRLADLLLRTRSRIVRALRATYSHVFIDEFQDTTHAQYALLLTLFKSSTSVVTAVGDDKQRIMVWAGARKDAFARFEQDFSATTERLLFNYRSSPELVRIQHVVARFLEDGTPPPISQAQSSIGDRASQIWAFPDQESEASTLASWIAREITLRGLRPRDFAVLVRQAAESFETMLRENFAGEGLNLLNVSKKIKRTTLQDLLSEELTEIVMSFLKLSTVGRSSRSWSELQKQLSTIRAIEEEDHVSCRRLQDNLSQLLKALKNGMAQCAPNSESSVQLVNAILEFLPISAVRRAVPRYSTGDTLEIAREGLLEYASCVGENATTWEDFVDKLEGNSSVFLMTIHKSKGLEYDSIFLVGLDDSSWWSYSSENPEGAATFFVALSRAKQRAIFTYCIDRSRDKVSGLYELLSAAGVQELEF
jgi:superfamily I DNA/RNA helicase